MERLTERDNGMTFLVCREGCNGGPACIECEQKAINRLAAYEDTMSIERALELAQAEKDGRLVVLPPNASLTLEELREMDGEPVWVEFHLGLYSPTWGLVNVFDEAVYDFAGHLPQRLSFDSYGGSWTAYRRRPEEG